MHAKARKQCWACKVLLQIDEDAFKCGHCGAITDKLHAPKSASTRQPQLSVQRAVVAAVALLISANAMLGSFWVLPALCKGWLMYVQQSLGLWTAIHIAVNLYTCVFASPGYAFQYLSLASSDQTVTPGQYDGYIFCQQCKFAKPPEAHHCRKCGRCVMDMDHHCFFLNNCIGRNNLRHFFLFLAWTLLGSLYVVGGVLCLLIKRRDALLNYLTVAGLTDSMLFWLKQLYYTVVIAPGWVQACAFMLTTASAGVVGTASLLRSQSASFLAGRTYISTLKDLPAQPPQKLSITQMLRMLAKQASWKYMWPAWRTERHSKCIKEL